MRLSIGDLVIEATAEQVESLRSQLGMVPISGSRMIDAASLAKHLGVSREYVYAHAKELGGEKLAGGPKSPWRFDADRIEERRNIPGNTLEPAPRQRRRITRRGKPQGTPLLEVRGKAPYAGHNEKRPPEALERQPRALTMEVEAPMPTTDPIGGSC